MTPSALDPSQPERVAPALLEYLRAHLDAPGLTYADEPSPVGEGWETYIYGFLLVGAALDGLWAAPLILRIFPARDLAWRAEQEAAVQGFVTERGYPAPRPLAVEPGGGAIGLPFMIMERAEGRTLLDRLSANPLAARKLIPAMAQAQTALHQLPIDGCPLPSEGSLVERHLAGFRARIEHVRLEGLDKEYAWLEANKGIVSDEERSLCHGDFHPQNVLLTDEGRICVLDWSRASLGDRHHDISTLLAIMRTAPAPERNLWMRLLDRFGRGMFIRRYLGAYRRQLPIDAARLRYWEALEAFEWLVRVSALNAVGSAAYGLRPEAAERLPPAHIDTLRRYFWKMARTSARG